MLTGKPLFPGKNVAHQLDIITDLLGTPPPESITKIRNDKARRNLSCMKEKPPTPFSQKFPNADPLALHLLKQLLAIDPKDRLSAEEALADPYFHGLANVDHEPSRQPISKLEFDFERRKLSKDDARELIYREAIPGPRVGTSSFSWILALPLAYAGLTLVIAFVKIVKKLSSPREKRRKLVNKNSLLCKSIDQQLHSLMPDALKALEKKTGFGIEEILRKYIRYALNEKPFNPDLVAHLIHLRKASMLDDSQVASILNDISAWIVHDKGPFVMDMSGYSEKGFKRKLAVQALFGKVFYLSELPEFCSRDSSLVVKEIFGVTDDDADKLRIHTLSEAGDMDSLEQMVDGSDSEGSSEESPCAP